MRSEIIAGDTLDFETSVPDYPKSDGWTLTYKLIPRTSGTVISFNASGTADSADDYRTQVGSTTTDDWAAGEYSWFAYVGLAGERYTVDQGTLTILPNPADTTAYDGRSHARTVLEAIEAVIEGRASKDQQSYSINGRSLQRMPIKDLLAFRAQYRAEVEAEDAQARIDSGLGAMRLLAGG